MSLNEAMRQERILSNYYALEEENKKLREENEKLRAGWEEAYLEGYRKCLSFIQYNAPSFWNRSKSKQRLKEI